jgi:hypothetical protein
MKSMTKLVLAMLVAAFVVLGVPQAKADSTGQIAVTVTLESVAITLDVTAYNVGIVKLQTTSPASPAITVSNAGNVAVSLTITGQNAAGGWTIGTPGSAGVFGLSAATNAAMDVFDVALSTAPVAISAAVPAGGIQAIKLQYTSPTTQSQTPGISQNFTNTVTAASLL